LSPNWQTICIRQNLKVAVIIEITNLHFAFFQLYLQFGFKLLLVIHAFEVTFCAFKCYTLEFTLFNSARWMFNVALNGIFALKLMPKSKNDKVD
jgi:hypothetical protein